ncbi:hypothetical protein A2947_01740 [Candidatus Peribacteria bacterium RIFCSPLOWO2_01_FULL_54_110]|nr:MAG: hypothetical protein A2789_01715 [Candidatus Peribacteria bacterium RIFCSPHIGHO2_01_FULL_54_22]OGJ65256.1 MAG: hypothetical protein A3E47_00570 [Candidatus Peribacteria bacterium RIFCSPHIGHO2_12_FULL_54_10]OGJ69012.1 MAG: hypothetical protein A2947_01740 [Candidatus Peribacteria bacterium RIFCSPLOWO2_01_FULL_54_110]
MGSLENALLLARTVGETVTKVQGPLDVHLLAEPIAKKFHELNMAGPRDLWWEGVKNLYDDCIARAPQLCQTLAEYAEWAEHMVRLWSTVLSAREMIVAWAGRDPTSLETAITPNTDLIHVREVDISMDFPKGKSSNIETIGNETIEALKKRGIDCFDPWISAKYRTRLSFAKNRRQAKAMHHQTNTSLLCGFYTWLKRTPHPPSSAQPKERTIGKEALRTRTLWPEEIVPERVGFRLVSGGAGVTMINEYEAMLRIALDLMKVSVDTKLPLVLPESKKSQP